MAQRYEERAEVDRDRLRRMVLYAQTALCRWKILADYFGVEMERSLRPLRQLRPADLSSPTWLPEPLPRRA